MNWPRRGRIALSTLAIAVDVVAVLPASSLLILVEMSGHERWGDWEQWWGTLVSSVCLFLLGLLACVALGGREDIDGALERPLRWAATAVGVLALLAVMVLVGPGWRGGAMLAAAVSLNLAALNVRYPGSPGPMTCSYCGYDLTGIVGDVCPECGGRWGGRVSAEC